MAKKKPKVEKLALMGDALTPVYVTSYEITEEPIRESAYRRLPKPVKERLESLHYESQSKPRSAIPELLDLKEKYPKVPQIYNYLAVAYSFTGENEKAEQITQEALRRNPDYLFARINLAQILFAKKDYEKIPELFDHKFDLKMLYPKRTKFHISEVANFMGTVGLYFAKTNQREVAEKYNVVLQEIASDYPIVKALKQELHPGVVRRVINFIADKNSAVE